MVIAHPVNIRVDYKLTINTFLSNFTNLLWVPVKFMSDLLFPDASSWNKQNPNLSWERRTVYIQKAEMTLTLLQAAENCQFPLLQTWNRKRMLHKGYWSTGERIKKIDSDWEDSTNSKDWSTLLRKREDLTELFKMLKGVGFDRFSEAISTCRDSRNMDLNMI